MKTLKQLVLLIMALAWVEGAPFHQADDYLDQMANLYDDVDQFQQKQNSEDILGNLQQHAQSEDLHQFQQNPFSPDSFHDHLDDLTQQTQRLEQTHENDAVLDKYVQQPQTANIERFPEYGQHREESPDNDYTQQFEPIQFSHSQQNLLPEIPHSGRLTIGQDNIQSPQGHESHLREYEQQPQSEDLEQYTQQHEQMGKLTEDTQQTQDHESFIDDSQQQSQVEDLSQFQLGRANFRDQQVDHIENLGTASDTFEQTQNKQNQETLEYPEQLGQIQVHDEAEDETQQKSQVADLSQYPSFTDQEQTGRLEDLAEDAESLQQTQEKHDDDVSQYPDQIGHLQAQVEGPVADDIQQIVEQGNLDNYAPKQTESLYQNQLQQGKIIDGQQLSHLEDMGENPETATNTEIHIENQEEGQVRQVVYAETEDDYNEGLQQQTQNEDLSQQTQNEDLSPYSIGQFRTEPKEPPLQISQVRHEQNPFLYNAPNLAAEVESHETEKSYQSKHEDQVPSDNIEVQHQASDHSLNGEVNSLNIENHLTTPPTAGFWKRLGAKIGSAYEKAKDKGRHVIHSIKESVG